MNNLITVKNLHVLKNGKFILQDINFTIDWQDRVAILGPNGAGKSFLLRVLSADLVPSFGSYVEIFGKVFGKTKLSTSTIYSINTRSHYLPKCIFITKPV